MIIAAKRVDYSGSLFFSLWFLGNNTQILYMSFL